MNIKSESSIHVRIIRILTVNILVLLTLAGLLVSLVEFLARSPKVRESITTYKEGESFHKAFNQNPTTLLGYVPPFNGSYEHSKSSEGKELFRKVYSFDEYGGRKTSLPRNNQKMPTVFLMGGSNTFGEGVSDKDTIGNLLQSRFKKTRVYNFAYRGWGPGQAWQIVNNHNLFLSQGANEKSLFLYFFYPYHLERLMGSPLIYHQTKGEMPYFSFDQSDIKFKGLTKERSDYRWKSTLGSFHLWGRIETLLKKVANKRNNLEKLAAFYLSMKKKYEESHPEGKFLIVFPPFFDKLSEQKYFEKLLDEKKIKYVFFEKDPDSSYHIPLDGHINESGHAYLADLMAPILSKQFSISNGP